MKLKILFFPLSFVIGLAVALLYVKPGIDQIMISRDQVSQKQKVVEDMTQKVNNAGSLTKDLDTHGDSEKLILRYLPKDRGYDRIVDSINFLSSQSGTALMALQIDKKTAEPVEQPVEEIATPSSALFHSGADASVAAPTEKAPSVQTIKATMSVVGGYENIKSLLGKLLRSDNFQNFSSVKIEVSKESGENEGGNAANALQADIEVQFAYFPYRATAVSNSNLFSSSTFDFTTAEKLKSFISSPVPDLQMGAMGKENPFL